MNWPAAWRPSSKNSARCASWSVWGDDVPDGKVTDFKGAVKAEAGENVVFSWVVWPSKAVRDEAGKKIMSDPRLAHGQDMPFDGKRLIYAGFELLLDSGE